MTDRLPDDESTVPIWFMLSLATASLLMMPMGGGNSSQQLVGMSEAPRHLAEVSMALCLSQKFILCLLYKRGHGHCYVSKKGPEEQGWVKAAPG